MAQPLIIAEALHQAGLIDAKQRDGYVARAAGDGRRFVNLLLEDGVLTPAEYTQAISSQLSLPPIDLTLLRIPGYVAKLLPKADAERLCAIPISTKREAAGEVLYVAVCDPGNAAELEEIARLTKRVVKVVVAAPADIERAIARYHVSMSTRPTQSLPAAPEGSAADWRPPNDGSLVIRIPDVEPESVETHLKASPLQKPASLQRPRPTPRPTPTPTPAPQAAPLAAPSEQPEPWPEPWPDESQAPAPMPTPAPQAAAPPEPPKRAKNDLADFEISFDFDTPKTPSSRKKSVQDEFLAIDRTSLVEEDKRRSTITSRSDQAIVQPRTLDGPRDNLDLENSVATPVVPKDEDWIESDLDFAEMTLGAKSDPRLAVFDDSPKSKGASGSQEPAKGELDFDIPQAPDFSLSSSGIQTVPAATGASGTQPTAKKSEPSAQGKPKPSNEASSRLAEISESEWSLNIDALLSGKEAIGKSSKEESLPPIPLPAPEPIPAPSPAPIPAPEPISALTPSPEAPPMPLGRVNPPPPDIATPEPAAPTPVAPAPTPPRRESTRGQEHMLADFDSLFGDDSMPNSDLNSGLTETKRVFTELDSMLVNVLPKAPPASTQGAPETPPPAPDENAKSAILNELDIMLSGEVELPASLLEKPATRRETQTLMNEFDALLKGDEPKS